VDLALQHLEWVQNGRWAHLEKRVAQPLLAHVERYLCVEHPHVEGEQAIHVLGEEGDVVSAIDQLHGLCSSNRLQLGVPRDYRHG